MIKEKDSLAGERTQPWEKAIGYAYATSITANQLGFGSTGCYYVSRERRIGEGRIESKPVSGHKTLREAQSEIVKISLPLSKFSLEVV